MTIELLRVFVNGGYSAISWRSSMSADAFDAESIAQDFHKGRVIQCHQYHVEPSGQSLLEPMTG